ncbi:MAG: DUF4838 domain-containing protein [Planctomycetaceae bacterium]|nr:DUF4838 domain-containing protein [Planctomycetaceae bacterium]
MRIITVQLCCVCLCFASLTLLVKGQTDVPHYKMRGVVLSVHDLETVDWAKLAHESGINTIGTHVTPEQVAGFMQSDKGKKFLADCKKYGIEVEHQLHAIGQLLPRELFADDPSMFRMNKEGKRVNDYNFCVHSQKALDIVAKNAAHYAGILPATNHRYYFWIDDSRPMCACPECSRYSDSEQALIVENRIFKELRKSDPKAMLAHLAYLNTLNPPRNVKPAEGVFLEYAPIDRSFKHPLSDAQARIPKPHNEMHGQPTHREVIQKLKENLTVFPAETAVVLEYHIDVSLFSKWRKPAVKLSWNKDIFESDIDVYAQLGIQNFTSFAVYIDDKYIEAYKDISFLNEYGAALKNYHLKDRKVRSTADEYNVITIGNNLITLDGEGSETVWNQAAVFSFTNPWNKEHNPPTSLKLLQDSKYLYFCFDVQDGEIVLDTGFANEKDAIKEDRVELFFSKDNKMHDYNCLEIDPKGRILSYQAAYYRNIDFDWTPPADLKTAAKIRSDGYCVEGAVPLEFVKKFLIQETAHSGHSVYFGAYRAEFSRKDGKIVENWQTWIDPQTVEPDFHVPSSLGKLKMK